jgi:hypothetical protein
MFVPVFVIKGQCDVLRLVDLSACDSYVKYHNRRRTSSANPYTLPCPSTNLAALFSPDAAALMLRGTSSLEEEQEESDDSISSSLSEINIQRSELLHSANMTKNRTKSAFCRTTRYSEGKSIKDRTFQSMPDALYRRNMEIEESGRSGIGTRAGNQDVGVGVYMAVDKLKPGKFFVSF